MDRSSVPDRRGAGRPSGVRPGPDPGGPALERAPLVLAQPTPDARVLAALECPLQTWLHHGASLADLFGIVDLQQRGTRVPDREHGSRAAADRRCQTSLPAMRRDGAMSAVGTRERPGLWRLGWAERGRAARAQAQVRPDQGQGARLTAGQLRAGQERCCGPSGGPPAGSCTGTSTRTLVPPPAFGAISSRPPSSATTSVRTICKPRLAAESRSKFSGSPTPLSATVTVSWPLRRSAVTSRLPPRAAPVGRVRPCCSAFCSSSVRTRASGVATEAGSSPNFPDKPGLTLASGAETSAAIIATRLATSSKSTTSSGAGERFSWS